MTVVWILWAGNRQRFMQTQAIHLLIQVRRLQTYYIQLVHQLLRGQTTFRDSLVSPSSRGLLGTSRLSQKELQR